MGVFLVFGCLMALLAGVSLLWRGTPLDQMWRANPSAYQRLAPLGKPVGVSFFVLSASLAVAGIGWFKRRAWGLWLATAIIVTQVLGDLINLLLGHFLQGATGVLFAGALLFYLLRRKTRAAFLVGTAPPVATPQH